MTDRILIVQMIRRLTALVLVVLVILSYAMTQP
jgi:hypothetical protein